MTMSKKKRVDEAAAVEPQTEKQTKWVAVATEDRRVLAEATSRQLLETIFNLIPQGRVVIEERATDDEK